DNYSCLFPKETLVNNQKSLLSYLDTIGQPKERAQNWQVNPADTIDVVDIVMMSNRSEVAETCFYAVSMTGANQMRSDNPPTDEIEAQPLVLLRSAAEIQRQLLVILYEE